MKDFFGSKCYKSSWPIGTYSHRDIPPQGHLPTGTYPHSHRDIPPQGHTPTGTSTHRDITPQGHNPTGTSPHRYIPPQGHTPKGASPPQGHHPTGTSSHRDPFIWNFHVIVPIYCFPSAGSAELMGIRRTRDYKECRLQIMIYWLVLSSCIF